MPRAKNGSVPRYGSPGYKTSYQKLTADIARLKEQLAAVVKERDEAQGFLASSMDTVNQEIRENGPADVGQYYRRHDANNGVRYLADLLKRKLWDAEAALAARDEALTKWREAVRGLEKYGLDSGCLADDVRRLRTLL